MKMRHRRRRLAWRHGRAHSWGIRWATHWDAFWQEERAIDPAIWSLLKPIKPAFRHLDLHRRASRPVA